MKKKSYLKKDCFYLRNKLGITQAAFWNNLGLTQSGGSRYENSQPLPVPTAILIKLVYGPPGSALALIHRLRKLRASALLCKLQMTSLKRKPR